MAKCNLGKVNLEAMLVSCFPSYSRGGPMPLAGAPRDLYTQLLACSSSQSVVTIVCCLRASLGLGKYWVGKYSTELFRVTVPGEAGSHSGRVAMDTSSSCYSIARLHQLCRHQRPSSSIGDEFK